MRARWIAGVIALGAVGGLIGGCMIFTGGTDGYLPADAGQPEASTVDGSCPADGGLCITLECLSSAECKGSTEAAPQVCCFGFVNGTTIGATCQANGCQAGIQACASNAECLESSCILQQCPGFDPITFKACGLGPKCSAISGGPSDAGPGPSPTDAGNTDASTTDASVPDTGPTDAGVSDAQLDGAG